MSGSSSTSQQPALSRPLSAMSWMDKDVSFFSSHESGGEDVDYFQTGEGLSLSGSSSSLLNLASSSGETTTKPELESHLSNTLKKQMSLKKTLESRIHSLQRTHKKTLSTLKKNIEAMKKLTFKAGGQEDKYQAKIGVYKSAIKGLLEGIPSLKGQLSQVSKELTRVQSEVGQKESELSRSREDYTRLQEELKALVSMQELELQNALLKKSSRSEESVEITHCKARYNRLVSEIESLNSVDSPKSIPGLTRKLEATHGHYQKWIEWNVQDKSLALNCLERQKEIQLWKDAVDKARETHVLLSETLTREIEFTERLQDELARCA